MNDKIDYIIYDELENERIDKYLASYYEDISRSTIQSMIKNKDVLVNNKEVKANYILETDDEIQITFRKQEGFELEKEDIKLDIIYEDDDIIVVNKPSGMVVHPAAGNKTGTLVNALLYHCNTLSNDDIRPGIVHRIDKDTSGLLVVCKNDYCHQKLSEQFQEHKVKKIYYAIVSGIIPHNLGKIEAPIGRDLKDRQKMAINEVGKNAITHFKVLERFKNHTLVELKLETGRTHQIRVHMQYIGYPVTGDPLYGYKKEVDEKGQFLHAKILGFYHPKTNEWMEFESDLPDYFNEYLNKLREEMK
ncbi:MAG: RluA family pseudouridine synthase [Bacilli bacterium]|nr:RluA family pseudouridine synthase [Bacilli bacterium]